jgi:hypothetical protein
VASGDNAAPRWARVNLWNTALVDADSFDLVQDETGTVFLRQAGAYPIVLNTNDIERMRVDPLGRIGIGKAAQSYRFEVLAEAGDQSAMFQSVDTGSYIAFQDDWSYHYGQPRRDRITHRGG